MNQIYFECMLNIAQAAIDYYSSSSTPDRVGVVKKAFYWEMRRGGYFSLVLSSK